jgi:hypothetical protein
MKRIVLFCIIFCLVAPIEMEAKKKLLGNGVYWELSDNGTLTISGAGEMPNYKWSEDSPFYKLIEKGKVYKIVICEGITSIGDQSFIYPRNSKHPNNIREVQLPNSLERIGVDAFGNAINLREINFRNRIQVIERYAFHDSGISNVVFPVSLSIIGDEAFANCKIRTLILPQSIVSIGKKAFAGNQLASLTIPSRIQEIGKNAFASKLDYNGGVTKMFEGEIISLPQFINSTNFANYGLSKQSFSEYDNSVHDKDGKVLLAANEKRTIKKHLTTKGNPVYIVGEKEKKGIMNDKGEWIIPLSESYTEIELLGNEFAKARRNNYFGIISLDGKEIIPTSRGYTSISNYNSAKGTFAFTKRGAKGVCNIQGKEISITRLAPTVDDVKTNGGYASVVEMKNGSAKYYKVSKGGRYGLTDSEGNEIIPCEMEALESAGTGYLKYKINGFWGVMNYVGKIIIDTDRGYTSIGNFVTFTKRFPYTMTGYKGECDINGKQISKIKVETPKQAVASSSSSSSSSSNNNSGNKTTTVVVEHHRDPVPVQEWQQCTNCWGEGKVMCQGACGGTGTYYVGDRLHICNSCGGTGKKICPYCGGQGGKNVTVYK